MVPAFIGETIFMDAKKWPPARCERLALWMHVHLVGQLVCLAGVAAKAGRHDVFPSGAAAFVPGRDVVEIELCFGQNFFAILTGKFVAQENIPPGKFYLKPREPVVNRQNDNLRNANGDLCAVDHFGIGGAVRVTDPREKIVSIVAFLTLNLHDVGVPKAE